MTELTIQLPEVEEIKPCPYVNGWAVENTGVSFMLKKYQHYSDFILFENDKPSRCFRFGKLRSEYSEENKNG